MPSWWRSICAQREDKKTGKFVQTLGSRKMWIRLRGQGHDVARCTVERIMREQGWEGARYGSKHKTTISDDSHRRYPDRVDRNVSCAGAKSVVGGRLYVMGESGWFRHAVCEPVGVTEISPIRTQSGR